MNIQAPSPERNPVKRHIVNDDTYAALFGENRSAQHQAALDYIARGYRIIPIVPDAKTPLLNDWHTNAIETAEAADVFWADHPNANIAICPEDIGMCVVEADSYKPDCEIDTLELPPTYEVESPRGGTHFYFKGSLRASASKLAKNVDTRGVGSYVLVPPSIVNGKSYKVKANRSVAELPPHIAERLSAHSSASTAPEGVEIDAPQNVMTARSWLQDCVKRGVVAVEGQGGDTQTYEVACKLVRDLGLSVPVALDLLMEVWNPHCKPQWDVGDLRTKLENAASYGQNEPGASTSPTAKEAFKNAPLDKVSEQPVKLDGKFLLTLRDIWNSPDPKPLVQDLLTQRENTCWYGPKKSGKSFAALDVALCVATGRPVYDVLNVLRSGPVVYLTGEGKSGFKKRILAWAHENGFGEDVDKFLDTVPFYFKPAVPCAAQGFDECKRFIDGIKLSIGRDPVLVIIDTMAKAMRGLNENDAGDGELYMAMAETLIEQLDCTTLTIAHSGKDDSKEVRGTSAFGAGFDAIWRIEANKEEKTLKLKSEDMKDSGDLGPYFVHLKPVVVAGMEYGQTAVAKPISEEQFKGVVQNGDRATREAVKEVLIELKLHSPTKGRDLDNMANILVGYPEPRPGDRDAHQKWRTARAKWKKKLQEGVKEKSGGKNRKPSPSQLRGLFTMEDYFSNGQLVPVFWMPEPREDELPSDSFTTG